MKILLTGATGFIGQHLGLELVQRGHTLTVLSRNPKEAKRMLPFPCEAWQWDPSNDNAFHHRLEGIDAVVHLAGESVAMRWTPERKKKIYRSRIDSTRLLVDAIFAQKPSTLRHFISSSAIGIYGNRDDEALTEDSMRGVGFLPDVCVDWENEANRAREAGVRVACVRTGVVLGLDGGALPKLLTVFKSYVGGKIGDGSQYMSWIHIDDLVQLYAYVIEHESISGPVNATAPNPVTNAVFTQTLARVLKRPAWLPAPKIGLKLALGEMSSVLLEGQRVLPAKLLASGFKFEFDDILQAFEDLLSQSKHPTNGEIVEVFTAKQYIPKPVDQVFPFFSSAENLERITPPWLNFWIKKKSTDAIEQGTLIDYELRLYGVPFGWRTRIEAWVPDREFIDTQLKGPYSLWHHTHRFEKLGNGTLMRDVVRFKVPFGLLGELSAGWFVRRDVSRIFGYRRKIIDEIFG